MKIYTRQHSSYPSQRVKALAVSSQTMMRSIQAVLPLLVSLLTILLPSTHASAVPPAELGKRSSGCTSDNCLRALKAQPYSSSASAFCATYTTTSSAATTTATTTGLPSYIPPACAAPTRVSSACSCFVTPTATAPTASCPTGQVITWPDFYGCARDNGGDCGAQLAPWTITHLAAGSSKGCELGYGYVWSYDGDLASMCVWF